jgi:exopolyphosphatase/guanosine-5'-triphosphate,3'-diphosphate pyrophosphatase
VARVAAIDCGTNSIRLLIADVEGTKFREIRRDMEIVRLGEGVDRTGRFDERAVERTLRALDGFIVEMQRRGVERMRFCATSATRDASNREIFVDPVRERLGIEPEVIPGSEEAALSFRGATKEFNSDEGPFLVVDIGGGSTEFVLGRREVESSSSVNIGCVRMAERHLHSNPPSKESLERAVVDIDEEIARAQGQVDFRSAKKLIAVAGTATTVAAASLGLASYDRQAIHLSEILAPEVHRVALMFQNMNRDQIAGLGYMHPGRIDVITAGALVLSRIVQATGAPSFIASESDILDGIALTLAGID